MPKPSPVFLKDGSVIYRVQYRIAPGKAPTSDRFETYSEALAFCALIDRVGPLEARLIREATTMVGGSVMTCRDAFDRFIEHASSFAEEGTISTYTGLWNRHIGPAFDPWLVGQVTRSRVEAWVAKLRKTETAASIRAREFDPSVDPDFISTKTIKNVQGLLSSVLRLQVNEGVIASNPAFGVRLPAPHPKRAAVFLSTGQRVDLLAATPVEWQTFVAFLMSTGLRWGEVTALRASDFDLQATPATVRVERAWKRGSSGFHVGPPKSRKSRRTVSLPGQLVPDLQAALEAAGDGLVFAGRDGRRLRSEWFMERVWNPTIEAAGISPKPRIHDLRHTHASMLLGAGVPIHIV